LNHNNEATIGDDDELKDGDSEISENLSSDGDDVDGNTEIDTSRALNDESAGDAIAEIDRGVGEYLLLFDISTII
jgi:hypothetical protein